LLSRVRQIRFLTRAVRYNSAHLKRDNGAFQRRTLPVPLDLRLTPEIARIFDDADQHFTPARNTPSCPLKSVQRDERVCKNSEHKTCVVLNVIQDP